MTANLAKKTEEESSDPFTASVGAFVLDTLTVGMYTDARDAIREYVQNSLDGIRLAVNQGLIREAEGLIELKQSPALDEVVISDNGAGLSNAIAARTLISIGKSSKRLGENAGFRGIGRLAGIAYCDQLVFETSHEGEEIGTQISFDCSELRSHFDPNSAGPAKDLEAVMRKSCTVDEFEAPQSSHFFRVHLKRLKQDGRKFLNFEYLHNYLRQYAPVDYDSQRFSWSSEVRKRILDEPFTIPMVNMELIDESKVRTPIRKPYRNRYSIQSGGTLEVSGIEFFNDPSDEQRYWGWFSNSELLGSITDKECSGLRVRVENILVGGSQLTRQLFSSETESNGRFNSYFVGEVFIRPGLVVPNARRDGFEDTPTWRGIRSELETLARKLSSDVRTTSTNRNKSVSKFKADVERVISQANAQKDRGFTSEADKNTQIAKIEKQVQKLSGAVTKGRPEDEVTEIEQLKTRLVRKKNEVAKAKSHAIKNVQSSLNRKQRTVLMTVYDVLKSELDEVTYNKVIERIEASLKSRKKSG